MPRPLVGGPGMSEASLRGPFPGGHNNRTQPKRYPPRDQRLGDALAALIWYCLRQGWRKSAGVEAREPTAPISADRRRRLFVVGEIRVADRAAVRRRGFCHHPRGLYRREPADASWAGRALHLCRHGGERLCV